MYEKISLECGVANSLISNSARGASQRLQLGGPGKTKAPSWDSMEGAAWACTLRVSGARDVWDFPGTRCGAILGSI